LDEERIFLTAKRLLEDKGAFQRMASATNPYGDGKAAQRTVAILKHYFGLSKKLPPDFQP
jgi:UDP-N-acetylglucosamine 2-epimerase (non-hydrolysing)